MGEGDLQKVTTRWKGGGRVFEKGDVIYEQKYGGPNQKLAQGVGSLEKVKKR